MRFYKTTQSPSPAGYLEPTKPQSCSSRINQAEFVRKKVLEYFPSSGYELMYPEPRVTPDRGKKVYSVMNTHLFGQITDKEIKELPFVKKNYKFQLQNKSIIQQRQTFNISQDYSLKTNDTPKSVELIKPHKRVFPEQHNRPSTNHSRQFGFLRTFHHMQPLIKNHFEVTKKHIPQNINNFTRDENIISLVKESPRFNNTFMHPSETRTQKKKYDASKHKNNQSMDEYDVENSFGGRRRKINTVMNRRNNLEMRSLGDKNYHYPEQTIEFYKIEGLTPGSTIQQRGRSKNENTLYESVDQSNTKNESLLHSVLDFNDKEYNVKFETNDAS